MIRTWLLTLSLLANVLGGIFGVWWFMKQERAAESVGDKVDRKRMVEENQVRLNADQADALGLEAEKATEVSWVERVPVYGRVVPNPKATSEVRSPFAGVLRAD